MPPSKYGDIHTRASKRMMRPAQEIVNQPARALRNSSRVSDFSAFDITLVEEN